MSFFFLQPATGKGGEPLALGGVVAKRRRALISVQERRGLEAWGLWGLVEAQRIGGFPPASETPPIGCAPFLPTSLLSFPAHLPPSYPLQIPRASGFDPRRARLRAGGRTELGRTHFVGFDRRGWSSPPTLPRECWDGFDLGRAPWPVRRARDRTELTLFDRRGWSIGLGGGREWGRVEPQPWGNVLLPLDGR